MNAHPAFYLGAFALRGPPLRKGVSFSRLVAAQVRTLAGGKWASTTITENKIKLVLVAFANQADFAAVQAHFGAPASSPSMKGALGGFSATFP